MTPNPNLLAEAVARHNAYGHVRGDADACAVCLRRAFATPVDGFVVRECSRCGRLICERDADTDADCDGEGYFTTSWTCAGDARADCDAITLLNELAHEAPTAFAVTVLSNAAEHLAKVVVALVERKG